jgi:cell division transport system permease protein
VLAGALTVGSVIRLGLFARRHEIEIMELVGAPLSFIKGPFIFEGVLQGAMGAVVGLAVAAAGLAFVKGRLAASAGTFFDGASIAWLSFDVQLLLVVGGMAVGCAGALVASRRLG